MPVLMRGGGGGKKTKDATALPEDVRSGKTFYGKDGKQTGIWTPKVIDFTGDATAVPSDVAKGKVFYNNDGKQVGTLVTYGKEIITLKKTTLLASTDRRPIVYISDTQVIGATNVSDDYVSYSSNVTRNVNINKKCVIKTSFRDRLSSIVSENIFFPRSTHDMGFGIPGEFKDFNATPFYVVFVVANDTINEIYLAVKESYQQEHEMLSDITIEINYF